MLIWAARMRTAILNWLFILYKMQNSIYRGCKKMFEEEEERELTIQTICTNIHNTSNTQLHNTQDIWKAFQAEPHPSLHVWYLTTSLICSSFGFLLVWSLYSVLTTFQHNFYVSNASLFGIEQSLKSNISGESEGSLYSTCTTGRPLSF